MSRQAVGAKVCDIAVNLTDCVFRGISWKGKPMHQDDLDLVLERANSVGVDKIIISGTTLEVSRQAVEMCRHVRKPPHSVADRQKADEEERLRQHREGKATPNTSTPAAASTEPEDAKPGFSYYMPGRYPPNDKLPFVESEQEQQQAVTEARGPWNTMLYCTVGVHPTHCLDFGGTPRPSSAEMKKRLKKKKNKKAAGTGGSESASPTSPDGSPTAAEDNPKAPVFDEAAAQKHLQELRQLIQDNPDVVVGIGEIGLDYAEEIHCDRFTQQRCFELQLDLAAEFPHLPLFLHSRDCGMDFVNILQRRVNSEGAAASPVFEGTLTAGKQRPQVINSGVVHSFNGSPEELTAVLNLDAQQKQRPQGKTDVEGPKFYIGLNGSSMRNEDLFSNILRTVPRNRLVVESDAPWCDIRPEHEFVYKHVKTQFPESKGKDADTFELGKCVPRRNEPCHCVQVVEAVHGCLSDLMLATTTTQSTEGSIQTTDGSAGALATTPSSPWVLPGDSTAAPPALPELAESFWQNTLNLFPGIQGN